MAHFLFRWLVNALSLLVVVNVVSGIEVTSWTALIIGALVLGLLNASVRWVVLIITLPLTLMTLGLFTLVINALMFYLMALIVKGFVITSFWSAFWGALIFTVVSWVLNLIGKSGGDGRGFPGGRGRPRVGGRDRVVDAEIVRDEREDHHHRDREGT